MCVISRRKYDRVLLNCFAARTNGQQHRQQCNSSCSTRRVTCERSQTIAWLDSTYYPNVSLVSVSRSGVKFIPPCIGPTVEVGRSLGDQLATLLWSFTASSRARNTLRSAGYKTECSLGNWARNCEEFKEWSVELQVSQKQMQPVVRYKSN